MLANGGRRATRLACGFLLATLASACTGDSDTNDAQPEPTEEDVDVSVGGGSAGGVSGGGSLSLESTFGAAPATSGLPGLSVRGEARGKAAADVVFVVVQPPVSGAEPFGESSIPPEDRKAVVEDLEALGVAAGDVSFESDERFGQPKLQVKVPVSELAARGPQVVETVERTLGRSRAAGATFSLSRCEPAGTPLRQQAIEQAGSQARALADAGKLSIGGIVGIGQDTGSDIPGLRETTEGCALVVPGQVEPFDARPEVDMSVAVDVTYAIDGAPGQAGPSRPLLWAAGSATAKVKADEAYVMVLFESEDEETSGGPSSEDRTRVLDALGKLKVAGDDVDITTRADYGVTTVVQVDTEAAGLATSGKDIVRAVEDVLGRSDTSGVRFSSSTCGSVLAKARRDAVGDARQRGATLAEAAGVKLGDVQWVSESTPTGADPCDDSLDAILALDEYTLSPLQPFDAEPEFTLTTTAHLGFDIE